jgi:hypothetical protein
MSRRRQRSGSQGAASSKSAAGFVGSRDRGRCRGLDPLRPCAIDLSTVIYLAPQYFYIHGSSRRAGAASSGYRADQRRTQSSAPDSVVARGHACACVGGLGWL